SDINTAGTTLNALNISGILNINAPNVTVQNCIINVTDPTAYWCVVVLGNANTGVVFKNCKIIGPGPSATLQVTGITIRSDPAAQVRIDSCDISQVGHGIDVGNAPTTIENCYIHDLNSNSESHYDGIFYGGGGGSNFFLLIQNNTVINQNNQTAAVFLQN